MKRILETLFLTSMVLCLANCGSSENEWGNIEAYKEAKVLNTTYVVSENNLDIIIQNEDNYLTNVAKENMIVFPKNYTSPSENKEISAFASL